MEGAFGSVRVHLSCLSPSHNSLGRSFHNINIMKLEDVFYCFVEYSRNTGSTLELYSRVGHSVEQSNSVHIVVLFR